MQRKSSALAGAEDARMNGHPAPPQDPWAWMRCQAETWSAGLDPAGVGQRLRAARLAHLIETATTASPLYRRRSRHAGRLADFEPLRKADLMQDFDDWATDRRITRRGVEAFLADPSSVADAWLGRYLVWTSSGTSGEPGIFVQDTAALAAYDAIDALRLRGGHPLQAPLGVWGLGRRFAFVGATGGHFAGHVSIERLRRTLPPWLAPTIEVLSVLEPLEAIAQALQRLQPHVLITYPSCAAALALLQARGALDLSLTEVWLGGEQFSAQQRQRVRAAFGCSLRNSYGASEFFSMAFECPQGQLHLNDDWVILEAVDAQMRPLPVGEVSHTTLLSNLANTTQPLLRYALDDRVRFLPGRCACGSGFPALEVQGRTADTLCLRGRHGQAVTVLPLALETVIEEQAQVAQFQVLRRAGDRLELRFESGVPDAGAAFTRCRAVITRYLERLGVAAPDIVRVDAAPLRQAHSGKLCRVLDAGRVASEDRHGHKDRPAGPCEPAGPGEEPRPPFQGRSV